MDFIVNLNWELVFTIFLAVFSALLVRDVFWWVLGIDKRMVVSGSPEK